jgi:CheY-like chemotaxis protein
MTDPGVRDGSSAFVHARAQALVVDDDPTNRLFLTVLLKREGYDVLPAEDGVQGVELFRASRPEIVFMDVMMPRMDGYEATRHIKTLAGDTFVPVIFLTALSDDEALAQCVDAGGDDFLTKPYRQTLLRSKIKAMQRIHDLHRRIERQHGELRILHARRQRDDEIAQQIFSRALAGNSAALAGVRSLLRPATTFSGDLLLAAHRPGGGLNILFGDFTGHGLAAAIGALPVSELFHAMTAKGFSAANILDELHRKLRTLLPTGMFLSACLVNIGKNLDAVEVWNGGMPDVLIVNGRSMRIQQRIRSCSLPLGITDHMDATHDFECVPIASGDRIVLYSDGLVEARNPDGQEFGDTRLVSVIEESGSGDNVFTRIVSAVDAHCLLAPQADDISLVEIPCLPELLSVESLARPGEKIGAGRPTTGIWRWALELRAQSLQVVDPVPVILNHLKVLPGLRDHQAALFTVLSELYTNALYHGVLGLDSALKETGEGFDRFYQVRDERLAALQTGYVRIEMEHLPRPDGGQLHIVIEDSGMGFDPRPYLERQRDRKDLSGRGIGLVRSLCESLRYDGKGSRAEVVYVWKG